MLLLTFFKINAQSDAVLQDFKKIHAHYQNMATYSMRFVVTMTGKNNHQIQKQEGQVIHTDKIHYVNYGGNITLIRNDEFVAVNMLNRFMVYNKSQKTKKQSSENMDVSLLLDSLWQNSKNLKFSYINAGEGKKTIFIEDSENKTYQGYALTFSIDTYRLLECVYYVAPSEQQGKIEEISIKYVKENPDPKTNLPELKIAYYVRGIGGKLEPSSLFFFF